MEIVKHDIFYFPNWELNYSSSPKMQELFEEKNYIKYGKSSKAIKYKDRVYISKHEIQGWEPMNRQFIWEKVSSWAYINVFPK